MPQLHPSFYKEVTVGKLAAPSDKPKRSSKTAAFPCATPRFSTLSELNAYRKKKAVADMSYDFNHDGGVSQREYFLATKFDSDHDGVLDPKESAEARRCMAAGFGHDDFRDYFSYKKKEMTRFDRVLQKTSRLHGTTYEDTFNRILTDHGTRHKMFKPRTPPPREINTGTRLWEERRHLITRSNMITSQSRKVRLEELEAARDKQRSKRSFAREGFLETPRHNTLQSLKKERWETARPHSSYDMDGDGVVSPRDYFIAKMFSGDPKHKHNHMLSPVERSQALEAVAKGLGKDSMETYFSFKQKAAPLTRVQKVLQKTFPVQTKDFKHTFERVLGNFASRNEPLKTASWTPTTKESLNHGVAPPQSNDTVPPPRFSGGWAGVPGPCAPRGHHSARW